MTYNVFGETLSLTQSINQSTAVCKSSWCRCQQLTFVSISTALFTVLLVIERLLNPAALKTSPPCVSHDLISSFATPSQQNPATPLCHDKTSNNQISYNI